MNQRIEFVLRALQTGDFRALCREYGISAKTGYKWRERFWAGGMAGMAEQSRRPQGSPRGLREEVVCAMIRLKQRHPHWGPRKLRAVYERTGQVAPSESSFKRVLERAGLTEPRRRRRAVEGGRLWTGRRAQRPNEVWTVDFKGWWYEAQGQKCEPLTLRDEYSRYVLEVRALERADTATVRGCLERVFERYGLPEAMRSDNGAPFASRQGVLGLSRLSAWWVALGIDLERGRPACPQDNGAHERLHGDIARELEGQPAEQRQAEFDVWRQTFNQERPHEALGMRCPAQLYTPSERSYAGTPTALDYGRWPTRQVQAAGQIHWAGQLIRISRALSGWNVGVEPVSGERANVWFGRLLLGQVEASTGSFRRATGSEVPPTGPRRYAAGGGSVRFAPAGSGATPSGTPPNLASELTTPTQQPGQSTTETPN